jgi:RsiW-degrading membrane proteinase PrsW (M82 family)
MIIMEYEFSTDPFMVCRGFMKEEITMFCTNCGKEILPGVKYCECCGARVEAPEQAPVWQPQQPQQSQQPQQPVVTQQTPIQPVYSQQIPPQSQQPAYSQQIPSQPVYNTPPVQPVQQIPAGAGVEQKDTFYVRKLPMVAIVLLTVGLFISSFIIGAEGSMSIAMLVASVPGFVLLFMIYKLDNIEPEPVPLLVKLFLLGGFAVPIFAIIVGTVLEWVGNALFAYTPVLYSLFTAFIVAAAVEETGKYMVLKKLTWKNPAFNYRFDGVVYSTTVALGFDIIENLLYLVGSDASTAYLRAAFPGHFIFGIYMGYYYGQAKSLELAGDLAGAKKMRRKGVITAVLIHGFYDFVCDISSFSDNDLILILGILLLVVVMCVLNVTAYKNIKKFAHEDRPV